MLKSLYNTNHIYIGVVYIVIGLIGGSLGFGLSIIIRLELALNGYSVVSSLNYNSIITFHGLLMIFFMIMPILIGGMGNVCIPILIGCNDMIFPRLNLFSLWLSLFSLILIVLSLLIDSGCNAGWTFYVPLSKMNYSSVDLLFFSLHLAGLSSLFGSINFISSILSVSSFSLLYLFNFIELFSWSIFFTSLLLIISIPVLAACITMIISDRHFNSCFFDPLRGGDLILFQHLFWFFGHPEVYILILPAFGLVSSIISKFTQFIIFGRDSMLIALFLIGLLGCIVWGHHMFVVGFDIDSRAYFTSSTSIIGIPTGIKLLNWLLTLWSNLMYLVTPIFFILGFLLSFSFGGFTGLILANSIIDLILHDSYFVVGHFHYVLSLGAVYAIFASFYTYSLFLINFPYLSFHSGNSVSVSPIAASTPAPIVFAISSYGFNDFIGRLAYVSFFISSNMLFLPLHTLGILGFPRRVFDYPIVFYRFNWLSSLSLIGIGLSLILFLLSFFEFNSFNRVHSVSFISFLPHNSFHRLSFNAFKFNDFLGSLASGIIKSNRFSTFIDFIRPSVQVFISLNTGAIPRFHFHTSASWHEFIVFYMTHNLLFHNWQIRLFHPSTVYNPSTRAIAIVIWVNATYLYLYFLYLGLCVLFAVFYFFLMLSFIVYILGLKLIPIVSYCCLLLLFIVCFLLFHLFFPFP